MRLPILQLSCRLFGRPSHHPGLSAPLQSRFGSLLLLAFPKLKFAVEREAICECDGHTVHTLSQRRLTADWLAPRESDCSRMRSKVSSDWLLKYIKAMQPVLEIFKWLDTFRSGIVYWPCILQNIPSATLLMMDSLCFWVTELGPSWLLMLQ